MPGSPGSAVGYPSTKQRRLTILLLKPDVDDERRGVIVALIFIGLPFVVRTLQLVLEDLDTEIEEAAACLGAHAP